MGRQIIDSLREYISHFPQEKNIIFLGDYVYHFSYDRKALMELYDFFLQLAVQGKKCYVLAWNHDWIQSHFVFSEAQKTLFVLKSDMGVNFITSPQVVEVEWKKVLFFPFMLDIEGEYNKLGIHSHPFQDLVQSTHSQEKSSGMLNALVWHYFQQSKPDLFIHHYYTAGIAFPGQRAKFSYKDIALDPLWLDYSDVKILSWHLHQPFMYKNYLCMGSMRHTSPLETNHYKIVAQYQTSSDLLSLTPLYINPHLVFQLENQMTALQFQEFKKQILTLTQHNLQSSSWPVEWQDEKLPDDNLCNLVIKVPTIEYEKMETYIQSDLIAHLKSLKLKKSQTDMKILLENLKTVLPWSENLQTFADRKLLLKNYLHAKYPNDFQTYLDHLQKLKII